MSYAENGQAMPTFADPAITIRRITPQCSWVTITPELAAQWLTLYNVNNRNIRDDHVARLANDMREGRWRGQNGEAVRFDWNNRLVDGQHRLKACVVAGVPFDTLLITGCDPLDYSTVGVGAAKNLGDFLGPVQGEKNVHLLAAGLRLVHQWKNGGLGTRNGRLMASVTQLQELLQSNQRIRESVHLVGGSTALRAVMSGSHAVLLHYAGITTGHEKLAGDFMEGLATGVSLAADDPIYQLRKKLQDRFLTTQRHRQEYYLGISIKAWNAVKRGQKMMRLQLAVDEEYPVL